MLVAAVVGECALHATFTFRAPAMASLDFAISRAIELSETRQIIDASDRDEG